MAFAEDLDEFLDTTQGFAVTATYQGATSVNGIFDGSYAEANAGGGAAIVGSRPTFLCKLASVPSVAQGHALVVNSTNYVVAEIHEDGQGMVLLVLTEQ